MNVYELVIGQRIVSILAIDVILVVISIVIEYEVVVVSMSIGAVVEVLRRDRLLCTTENKTTSKAESHIFFGESTAI